MRRFCTVLMVLLMVTIAGASENPGAVEGTVSSAGGELLGGVEVAIDPPLAEAVTGEDGRYEFANLPPGVYVVTVRVEGYAEATGVVAVETGARATLDLVLTPAVRALGSIEVTSTFSLNRSDPVPGVAISREELLELPHFGDDVIRAMPLLPGVAGNDTSARFNVRGGLDRETLVLLDGIELFEPYHLKDYQGVFSVVDPRLLDEVQLMPGGFAVEYGDRLAGVLDLTTGRPTGPPQWDLGISFTNMWASGSGGFGDGRGSWFASARRGYLDLILDFVGPEDEEEESREGSGPQYWDLHSRISWQQSPSNALSLHLLISQDGVDEEEREIEDGFPEYEYWDTSYGNSYLWGRDERILNERTFVETIFSVGRVDRDRISRGESYNEVTDIADERTLDLYALRSEWSWQPDLNHYLKWGVEGRRYEATYDYLNSYENPFDLFASAGSTEYAGEFESTDLAVWLADRVRLTPKVTAEVGLRWDRQSLTDDDQLSPRVNAVWALDDATSLRLGWGLFFQSQRPHELQVEDGETTFATAERAEHRTLGIERLMRTRNAAWSVRVDAFQRLIDDPRPRYENLFEPLQLFPETSYDRYRVAPTSANAEGIELFLSRRGLGAFDWWMSYSWSEATDEIDGRDVPRQFDQTHAATLSATWRPSKKWTVSAAWIYHTGWPTTAVFGELVQLPDGSTEVVPVLGPINGERLPDYHRLDVRVSRTFTLRRRGTIELFFDIQNLYDRANVAGYEVDDRAFTIEPDGQVTYIPNEEKWLGVLPSFGVRWRF